VLTALFLQASAVVPALLLLWFFSSRDLYPEPARRVWAAFWAGILAMLLALAAALPIQAFLPGPEQASPLVRGFLDAFLTAAIPEECAKFLVLLRFCRKTRDCDEPMDCVVYGVAASLGFATLENILYVSDGGFALAAARAVSAVPSHAMDGAVMGFFLGRALFSQPFARGNFAKALLFPIIFHGLYDFPLLALAGMDEAGTDIPVETGLGLIAASAAVLLVQAVLVAAEIRTLRREQRSGSLLPSGDGPRAARRSSGAWAAVVVGALLGSASGLGALFFLVGLLWGETKPEDMPTALIGGAVIFLAPFLLGLTLFILGLRRIGGRNARQGKTTWRRYDPGRLS